jgi:hypothetical protein
MRLGKRQRLILACVAVYPGESILSIDHRTNSGRAHYLTYDAVHRLKRRRLMVLRANGSRYACYLPEQLEA